MRGEEFITAVSETKSWGWGLYEQEVSMNVESPNVGLWASNDRFRVCRLVKWPCARVEDVGELGAWDGAGHQAGLAEKACNNR